MNKTKATPDITTTAQIPKFSGSFQELQEQIKELATLHNLNPEKDQNKLANLLGLDIEELKDIFRTDRQERLLKKAELTSEELLDLNLTDKELEFKYGKTRLQLFKLKLQESQFIRETLGKDLGYSKRNELTGKNGNAIEIKEIVFTAPILPQQ